jgi:glycosyltransferase involved in cell wall biosynthesis
MGSEATTEGTGTATEASAAVRDGGAAEARRTGRAPVSACVIAFDEEPYIADCLRSLAWCDELVLVDSHSTDRTREIAAELGARVIERDWPGFGEQKEFAVAEATHDWVLCLDADERVTPELRAEIEALQRAGFPGPRGWRIPRLSSYMGRWIRHGTWYPSRQLRLYHRAHGRWGGNPPHEKVLLDSPPGTLKGDLQHYPYRSFADHLAKIDSYTTTKARGMHARGKRARALDLFAHPAWRFLSFYVLRLGFLEGWRGFLLACLTAHYNRMKYAKLLVLQRGERLD